MARPLRIDHPGDFQHVTNRGRSKQAMFFDDADRELFLEYLQSAIERGLVDLHSFSLMTTHYHLLLSSKIPGGLSRAMQTLGSRYTLDFNHKYGLDGSLCKGRFFSKLIDNERYLSEVVRYIANNAPKAGLVRRASEHKWSSHAMVLEHPEAASVSLSPTVVETYFNGNVIALDRFVNERNTELGNRYELVIDAKPHEQSLSAAIGYIDEARARLGKIHLGSAWQRHHYESLVEHVCQSFGLSIDEIAIAHHDQARIARLMLMALLHYFQITTLGTLAIAFDYGSKQSVSRMLNHFARKTADDHTLNSIFEIGKSLIPRAA